MIGFLTYCSVVATAAGLSAWLQLQLGQAIAITVIGIAFTIIWLGEGIAPRD